jgi:hypothetical protein
MADIRAKYGTSNQAVTITLASLTNNSSRQSTAITNATNEFLDALVQVKIRTGASGTSTTGVIEVFVYASADGGTTYTDGVTGTDGAFTPTSPSNLRPLGAINAVANATTYIGGPWSVAQAFGGTLPERWGIVVKNSTGATLDATGSNFAVFYQGVLQEVV